MDKPAEDMPPQQRWRRHIRIPKELAALLAFAALVAVGYFGQNLTRRLGLPERCWEVKEIDGELYKLNPCAGQFLLLGDAAGAAPTQ